MSKKETVPQGSKYEVEVTSPSAIKSVQASIFATNLQTAVRSRMYFLYQNAAKSGVGGLEYLTLVGGTIDPFQAVLSTEPYIFIRRKNVGNNAIIGIIDPSGGLHGQRTAQQD